ncbi:hypothetical protein TanjilG_26156 [Lupinus angustifolius]|uniref:Uncharacterized protein n=1 Tax=Lupinus angustifolius TaxID=3871 RepID=A0A4P1R2U8_LUPAN|nr:hypothetical protein TanjilG_26156 [Lupinus angustifolius]
MEPTNESERSPISSHQPHSSWHSPVPYLFGGLATVLALIVFALLIIVCSYWKLSRHLRHHGDGDRDVEAGTAKNDDNYKPQKSYEEKVLVIMAGQEKPTFLATPVSSSNNTTRSSSFGDNTGTCTCDKNEEKSEENVKQGSGSDNQVLQNENRETVSDQNR